MYRPTELSAALARSQLQSLESWNEAARRNAKALSSRLAELPGIEPLLVPQGRTGVFHKYRVRFDANAMVSTRLPRTCEASF